MGCPFAKRKDVGIQCSESRGRYGRNEESKILTYDQLTEKYFIEQRSHTILVKGRWTNCIEVCL